MLNYGSLLFLATGSGIASWMWFRRPYPWSFPPQDVWKIRLLSAEADFYSFLARCGSVLRLGSQIDLLRKLYQLRLLLPLSARGAEIYREEFNENGVNFYIYRNVAWVSEDEDVEELLRPCLVYLHGGGFVFTDPLERDIHHRHLVNQLDAVVIAVRYRRAPEHIFPAAVLDAVAAVKHIHSNSLNFGIDPNRITLSGDSAGGNLTAAVALKLRDEGLRLLKNQVLIYPAVQFINTRLNSYMIDFPLMSKADAIWCCLTYTGFSENLAEAVGDNEHVNEEVFGNSGFLTLQTLESHEASLQRSLVKTEDLDCFRKTVMNPYLCPLMARTLKSLPKALLILCEYDVLLDDGLAYAKRLSADNVDVTVVRVPGYHGAFRDFYFTKCGKMIMDAMVKWLRDNL